MKLDGASTVFVEGNVALQGYWCSTALGDFFAWLHCGYGKRSDVFMASYACDTFCSEIVFLYLSFWRLFRVAELLVTMT